MLRKLFFFIFALLLVVGCTTEAKEAKEAEDPEMKEFAQCLFDSGVRVYGSFTCSICARQRKLFGPSFHHLKEIECHPHGENSQSELCLDLDIAHTPTWISYENDEEVSRMDGFQGLESLSKFSGCSLAEGKMRDIDSSENTITGKAVAELEYVDLKISKAKCDNKGKLSLVMKNVKDKAAVTSEIEVIAQSHQDPSYEVVVPGKWRFPSIKKWDPKLDTKQKKKTSFSSETGTLNLSGNYDIIVNYKGCKTDPGCSTKSMVFSCPGNTYKCDKCNLEILKCENKKDVAEITFSGLNRHQYEQTDVRDELLFSFFGEKKTMTRNNLPDEIDYKVLPEDNYVVKVPTSEFGQLARVEVTHPYCDVRSFLLCSPLGEEVEIVEKGVCLDSTIVESQLPKLEQPLKWDLSTQDHSSRKVTIIVIEEPSEAKAFTDKLVELLSTLLSSS